MTTVRDPGNYGLEGAPRVREENGSPPASGRSDPPSQTRGVTMLATARSVLVVGVLAIGCPLGVGAPSAQAQAPSAQAPRYSVPTPVYSHPGPRYSAPAPVYSYPAPCYYIPAPVYSYPVPWYSVPAPVSSFPARTFAYQPRPYDSYSVPSSSSSAPDDSPAPSPLFLYRSRWHRARLPLSALEF